MHPRYRFIRKYFRSIYGKKWRSLHGPYKRKDGRKHVILYRQTRDGRQIRKTISYPKLLIECRIGRKLKSHETADHKDEDFTNNRWKNLQILSRSKNASKSHALGDANTDAWVRYSRSKRGRRKSRLANRGEKNPNSHFSDKDVKRLRKRYAEGKTTMKKIARRYSVSLRSVNSMLKGKTYSHVGGPLIIKRA